MIKVMTSTYKGDLEKLLKLNSFLEDKKIEHHIFVEPKDIEYFNHVKYCHEKPIGGDNGMGRAGAMVRWVIYQEMFNHLKEGDTYVQMDSDIDYMEDGLLKDLECKPNEMKAFFNFMYPFYHKGFKFFHGSGFCISAGYEIFKKSIPITLEKCETLCNDMINYDNLVPSEDVILSYLLQFNGAEYINLNDKYTCSFKSVKGERQIKYL